MSSAEVHANAISFLNRLQAQEAAQEVEDAACFIVCTFDPQTGNRYYDGPFDDPVEAMRWANEHKISSNTGLGSDELPYEVTVEVVSKREP